MMPGGGTEIEQPGRLSFWCSVIAFAPDQFNGQGEVKKQEGCPADRQGGAPELAGVADEGERSGTHPDCHRADQPKGSGQKVFLSSLQSGVTDSTSGPPG